VAASSLEVSTQLWAVIARYRFAAVADRVRITLVSPDGKSDMNSLSIRTVPGDSGLARLEFGDITLVARRGVLRAIHARDRATYVEISADDKDANPATVLRDLLPVLALPQISLAFDEGDVSWCPLVTELAWESAQRITIDGAGGVRLSGKSSVGRALLEIAEGRVRRFEADLTPDGQTRLIVECTPITPGDPATWPLDLAGRRKLTSLALLRPLGPGLHTGDSWPTTLTLTAILTEQPLTGNTSLAHNSAIQPIYLYRDGKTEAETRVVFAILAQTLREFGRDLLRGRIAGRLDKRLRLLQMIGVVEVAQDGQTLDRLDELQRQWQAFFSAENRVLPSVPALAWVAVDTRLIDRLWPGASGVLVLLDGSGRIIASLPVEPDTTVESLRGNLLSAINASATRAPAAHE